MPVTVIPTERDQDGNTVLRWTQARPFEDLAQARSALAETVARMMDQAGMTYDGSRSLEENTDALFDYTGIEFGWIIDTSATPENPPDTEAPPQYTARPVPALYPDLVRFGYVFCGAAFLFLVSPVIERLMRGLELSSPQAASLSAALIRSLAIIAVILAAVIVLKKHRK